MNWKWFQRFRASYFGISPLELKQRDCTHPNESIEGVMVEPITILPKTGRCKLCNKNVKARIIWR